MIHIAIMKKSWGLTQKILSGEKTIETRWYMKKSKPWDFIKAGETLYFKDSGEPITVKATIEKVEQFSELNNAKISRLLQIYSVNDLGTKNIPNEIKQYVKGKKYVIIIHLGAPQKVIPFKIDKTGYGAMSSWLCLNDINKVRLIK